MNSSCLKMTCRKIYTTKGVNIPFILCLILLLNGCSKSQAELELGIYIRSPQEGAFLMHDEPLFISVDIRAPGGFEHMELYLDQKLLAESTRKTFDTLVKITGGKMDSHQIRINASSKNLGSKETSRLIYLVERTEEASDLESFRKDALPGWFLSNWQLAKREDNPEILTYKHEANDL